MLKQLIKDLGRACPRLQKRYRREQDGRKETNTQDLEENWNGEDAP
jgi:hypothetical protein